MIPLTLDEIVRVVEGRTNGKLSPVTVTGVSTDSRTCAAGDVFFAIRGERFDGHAFVEAALEKGAFAAVVDQTDPPDERPLIRVGNTVEALGRLAAFHRRQRSMNVVAVTGSNGKTTTKCMIEHVLSWHLRGRAAPKSYNNAIGVPLTLLSACVGDDYLVVEMGSDTPGEIASLARMASPNIGVVTSIGEAHLAGLGDLQGVAAEKMSLLKHVRRGGLAVVNAEMPDFGEPVEWPPDLTKITFGRSDSADICVSDIVSSVDSTQFKINGKYVVRLAFAGTHNALNAAAAFTVCRRLQIGAEQIVEALESLAPPPMRLNVSRLGRMTLIDDSYNANPASTEAAIEVLIHTNGGRRVFVVGDMLELGAQVAALHERVGRRIAEAGIDVLVAVGEHANELIGGALSVSRRLTTIRYADTAAACGDLPQRLAETDSVLIKGSRRLELDRLVRCVRQAFA